MRIWHKEHIGFSYCFWRHIGHQTVTIQNLSGSLIHWVEISNDSIQSWWTGNSYVFLIVIPSLYCQELPVIPYVFLILVIPMWYHYTVYTCSARFVPVFDGKKKYQFCQDHLLHRIISNYVSHSIPLKTLPKRGKNTIYQYLSSIPFFWRK